MSVSDGTGREEKGIVNNRPQTTGRKRGRPPKIAKTTASEEKTRASSGLKGVKRSKKHSSSPLSIQQHTLLTVQPSGEKGDASGKRGGAVPSPRSGHSSSKLPKSDGDIKSDLLPLVEKFWRVRHVQVYHQFLPHFLIVLAHISSISSTPHPSTSTLYPLLYTLYPIPSTLYSMLYTLCPSHSRLQPSISNPFPPCPPPSKTLGQFAHNHNLDVVNFTQVMDFCYLTASSPFLFSLLSSLPSHLSMFSTNEAIRCFTMISITSPLFHCDFWTGCCICRIWWP